MKTGHALTSFRVLHCALAHCSTNHNGRSLREVFFLLLLLLLLLLFLLLLLCLLLLLLHFLLLLLRLLLLFLLLLFRLLLLLLLLQNGIQELTSSRLLTHNWNKDSLNWEILGQF